MLLEIWCILYVHAEFTKLFETVHDCNVFLYRVKVVEVIFFTVAIIYSLLNIVIPMYS